LNFLGITDKITLIPFDLLDQSSIISCLEYCKPHELYNLAAQSFVGASFEQPIATGEITGLGLTRVLDTMKSLSPKTRFYQASSSEMFGGSSRPLNEESPFKPRSPYAAAKLYSHWVTVNYREAYDLHASSGILFNHESPIRGLEFVTRKITYYAALIKHGYAEKIYLGNVEAKRDWGFAGDYVEAMWLMLQQDHPDDYVIATGHTHSVRDFAEKAFSFFGLNFDEHLEIDSKFFRPTEVNMLLGDASKAEKSLGWNPTSTKFEELIEMMCESDNLLVSNGLDSDSRPIFNIKEIPHFKE